MRQTGGMLGRRARKRNVNTMKTYILAAAAVLLMAAGTAQAAQVCGAATCTTTDTDTETVTQGNTSTQVNMCTGNIIIQVSGNDSIACSGQTQNVANCQTEDFKAEGCGGASVPGGSF